VVKLELPSLARRKEDIPLLAEHFIEKLNRICNRHILRQVPGFGEHHGPFQSVFQFAHIAQAIRKHRGHIRQYGQENKMG
jgi:transcriptional regulator of aromatic amino acid metabolism